MKEVFRTRLSHFSYTRKRRQWQIVMCNKSEMKQDDVKGIEKRLNLLIESILIVFECTDKLIIDSH